MSQSRSQTGHHGRMTIGVYGPSGRLKSTVVHPVDSYLDNWYLAMASLMDQDTTQDVTTVGATTETIQSGDGNASEWSDGISTELAIGDDGSQFQQSDSSLGNQLQQADTTSGTAETANQLVRFSASFSFSSPQTIRETGIRLDECRDTDTNSFDMFIERTVLGSPVSVSSGDSASVTYELTWAAP